MPRKTKPRKVAFAPEVTYFKPWGVAGANLETMKLKKDEIEALRLADFEGKDQHQAAKEMAVSQSTFQRILARARKKVAEGLILAKAIKVEGGGEEMVSFGRGRAGGRGLGRGQGFGRGRMGGPYAAGPGGVCVCVNPQCKKEVAHQPGLPCYQQKCPACGSPMIRKK